MKRLVIMFVLACMVCVVTVSADEIKTAPPQKVGLSAERMERIDGLLQRHVADGKAVGAVGLVARHGKIAYCKAFGNQDAETCVPMTTNTIFRVYSMTKPITSVGLMMLYEEGRFRLQDPLFWYLPEFKDMKVAVEEKDPETGETTFTTVPTRRHIIIRDLLRHTSGISYNPPPETTLGKMYLEANLFTPDQTLEELVNKLSKLPLVYQPGTRYEYGFSVDVIGRLIEVISGQPYEVYMKEQVLDPLGMTDTAFYVPEEKVSRFAQLYQASEDGTLKPVPVGEGLAWPFLKPTAMPSPGGGLVSTARDYLRFAQMLLNGGELDGVRLLSPKTIELMTQDHLQGIEKPWWGPAEFGLGFYVEQDPGTAGQIGSKGTFGWSGAASTQCWVDPEEDMITLFMIQTLGDCPLTELFKITAYQTIVE